MAERILIWGAGAIGGSVGAWLKRAGHDVTLVDVVAEHVAAIRNQGLRITGPVEEFAVTAPAFVPGELTGTWQRIFLAVKAQHTEAAAKSSIAAMVAFNSTSAKTHSGVWRDLAIRRRRTEVDVQIAPIAEIGARHGIDSRATRTLVDMIHEVEEGRRAMTDDNLLELAQTAMAGARPGRGGCVTGTEQ
jgi:ketopantoate reductase